MKRGTRCNEIKTSLTDEEYEALQRYKAIFDVTSDADAIRKFVRQCLFGTVGNLPANLIFGSEEIGQTRTKVPA
ncbi:hypothetical protein ACLKMY_00610 [Paraburkholderia mimosarum]|uniref:hypothetical protein n=1 Tax=Paraburkholderia mimosarum TaxID=312026 RepID=UPI0039C25983